MSGSAVAEISDQAIVRLPSGVRLKKDEVRDRFVLLAPERALVMDAVGVAILGEIDGAKTVQQMIASLASTYAADPQIIGKDVKAFLLDLAGRRIVEISQ